MSDGITSLSDVLNGSPIEEPTVEAVVEPVNELKQAEVTAEPTVVETPTSAPTAEAPKDEVSAFKQAMLDERTKRQELEKQLEAYKSPVVKPDAYSEPEEAINFGINTLEQKVENRFLNMSEYNAQKAHTDFEAMKELFFNEMLTENPSLQQQALAHPDPYGFIYDKAKAHSEFKNVSNLDEWKSQKEAEIRAKVEAERAAGKKAEFEKKLDDSIPPTLSNATAAGGAVNDVFTGNTPLDKIIGKK